MNTTCEEMNTSPLDVIKAQTEAVTRAYMNGHDAGYRKGYNEALIEARRIIKQAFPEFEFPALAKKQAE